MSQAETKHDAHDLLPESIAKTLPPLYATENHADPMAHVKWFTPDSYWAWYVLEYDPDERLCFGFVQGHEEEYGYFRPDEIDGVRGPKELLVERDLSWSPTPLSEIQRELELER